jgi:DNA polymerase-3 subunit gamma/tau
MEPFVVSALKYRPQKFGDVVGQHAITQTLENAIEQNHLAQALLFCGPRGVGKTTCARILAKKINIQDGIDTQNDFAFNIFELDAASNNSVEDIRNLIDQVRIPPQIGKFKVYIIDEVHMLSQAAFNAFLKTLEEPPAHAIFILATTEKHKIIPTILSRCQIFDFKRIGITDAKNHLSHIAKEENIEAEEEALQLIAQKADGAMRDALSIFDRIVSFSGNKITAQSVSINLNILDFDTFINITDHLIEGNIRASILVFDQVLSKGFDGHHFITGLGSHLRDLWMAKNEETIELLEVAETTKAKYLSQSKNASMDFLEKALQLSNDCDLNYKSSKNQRLLVELCLMQIASVNDEKKKTEPYIKPPSLEEKEPQKKEVKQYHKNDIEPPVVSEPESNQLNKKEVDTKTDDLDKEPEEQSPSLKIDIKHKGVSGLSLSSIKLKKEFDTQKQTSALQPKREEKFSQEELEKIWSLSVKEQEKKGAHNLVALLKLDTPRLKNGNEIHLTFPNNTNKKELEREKRDIMLFLGEQLKNDTLSLKIHVDVQEDKKFIYTPKDKYDQLVAINPLVDDFRKEFDLDL